MTENRRPSLKDTRTLLDVIPQLREEVCRITRPERFARFSLSVDVRVVGHQRYICRKTQTLRNSAYKHVKVNTLYYYPGARRRRMSTMHEGKIFIKRGLNVEDDGTLNERAANEGQV